MFEVRIVRRSVAGDCSLSVLCSFLFLSFFFLSPYISIATPFHLENLSSVSSFFSFISEELRKLSWSGIPSQYRATTWKLLSVSSCYCVSAFTTFKNKRINNEHINLYWQFAVTFEFLSDTRFVALFQTRRDLNTNLNDIC